MMKITLPKPMYRAGFAIQKHSPAILVGVGIVSVVGAVVTASKATLKAKEILDKTNEEIQIVETLEHEDYSEEDRQNDLKIIMIQTILKLAKEYALSALLLALGITSFVAAHNIQHARLVGASAALAGLKGTFDQYRDRVKKEVGEDKDRAFLHNLKEVDIKDGKKTETKYVFEDYGLNSEYSRYFDEHCYGWSDSQEYNISYLKAQESFLTTKLAAQGHLFLNEVYDALGIPRSKAGSVVGWLYSDDENSDNYVDFGVFTKGVLFNADLEGTEWENILLLDFNVDGVIWDKI